MPWMKNMISFFNASFHKIIKQKARYLHTVDNARDVIFQWKFSMKLHKKTDTYMPWMKSLISFFNESFHKIIKQKAR